MLANSQNCLFKEISIIMQLKDLSRTKHVLKNKRNQPVEFSTISGFTYVDNVKNFISMFNDILDSIIVYSCISYIIIFFTQGKLLLNIHSFLSSRKFCPFYK